MLTTHFPCWGRRWSPNSQTVNEVLNELEVEVDGLKQELASLVYVGGEHKVGEEINSHTDM